MINSEPVLDAKPARLPPQWTLLDPSMPAPLDALHNAAVTKNRVIRIPVQRHWIEHAEPTKDGRTTEVGSYQSLLCELTKTGSDLQRRILRRKGSPAAEYHSGT
jgi:hypothetical protein